MASIFAQGTSKVLRAVSTVLPSHTKRLMLWSMLYSKMCGGQSFTKEQCDRLNGALTLCKDKQALALPARLSKFICSDLDECTGAVRKALRGEKSTEIAAVDFVRSIPSWLRYASDAFMLRDFQLLMAAHRRA